MPELTHFTTAAVDIFAGEESLHEHACAERADTFIPAAQQAAYRLARTRADNLERYLDAFTARDLKRLRWAQVAGLVRQVAGKKAR